MTGFLSYCTQVYGGRYVQSTIFNEFTPPVSHDRHAMSIPLLTFVGKFGVNLGKFPRISHARSRRYPCPTCRRWNPQTVFWFRPPRSRLWPLRVPRRHNHSAFQKHQLPFAVAGSPDPGGRPGVGVAFPPVIRRRPIPPTLRRPPARRQAALQAASPDAQVPVWPAPSPASPTHPPT